MKKNIEVEEHSEELISAMNIVKANGFLIKKLTDQMREDASKCKEMKSNNKTMNCTECSCNICAVE